MATMIDLINQAPKDAPVITVRKDECILNRKAVDLLRLDAGYVKFAYDRDALQAGRKRVYVYNSLCPGYAGVTHGHQKRICNKSLCEKLANMLNGYGRYRICEEICNEINGVRYYEIFFKRYD